MTRADPLSACIRKQTNDMLSRQCSRQLIPYHFQGAGSKPSGGLALAHQTGPFLRKHHED